MELYISTADKSFKGLKKESLQKPESFTDSLESEVSALAM